MRGQLHPDDKRRLSTATNKDGSPRPSWVSDIWFQKQEREIKSRNKGKAKVIGECTFVNSCKAMLTHT